MKINDWSTPLHLCIQVVISLYQYEGVRSVVKLILDLWVYLFIYFFAVYAGCPQKNATILLPRIKINLPIEYNVHYGH